MSMKYEERIKQMQEATQAAQIQRDEALKQLVAPAVPPLSERQTRAKYEEKIKKLSIELKESKDKIAELLRHSKSKGTTNDLTIKNLRASLEVVKNEKNRLQAKLAEDSNKRSNRDFELKDCKNKEKKAIELVKKWKHAFEIQKEILNKRTEQVVYAKNKIKSLNCLLKEAAPPASGSIDLQQQQHSMEDQRALSLEDEFFPGPEEVTEYLEREIAKIKDFATFQLRELQIGAKIFSSPSSSSSHSLSPGNTSSRGLQEKSQAYSSLLLFFSPERSTSLIGETIKSCEKGIFKKNRILFHFYHLLQLQLHGTLSELRQSLRRAISLSSPLGGGCGVPSHGFDEASLEAKMKSSPLSASRNQIVPMTLGSEDELEQTTLTACDSFLKENPSFSSSLSIEHSFEGHLGQVFDVHWMPSEEKLFSAGQDGSIKMWSLDGGGHGGQRGGGSQGFLGNLCSNFGMIRALASYPRSKGILFAACQSLVKGWDLGGDGSCSFSLSNHSDDVYSLATTGLDDNYLFSGSSDNSCTIWDLRHTQTPLGTLTGHQGTVFSICTIPEYDLLFTASRDHTIKAWSLSSHCLKATLNGAHSGVIKGIVRWPFTDTAIASASRDCTLKKWLITGGLEEDEVFCMEAVNTYPSYKGHQIESLAFNGNVLGTGDRSGSVYVWNEAGSVVAGGTVHSGMVNSICGLGDGGGGANYECFATASADRTVKVLLIKGE